MTVFPSASLGKACFPAAGLRVALRPVLLEACAAINRSSPYSECLGCSQYVPVLPETPHPLMVLFQHPDTDTPYKTSQAPRPHSGGNFRVLKISVPKFPLTSTGPECHYSYFSNNRETSGKLVLLTACKNTFFSAKTKQIRTRKLCYIPVSIIPNVGNFMQRFFLHPLYVILLSVKDIPDGSTNFLSLCLSFNKVSQNLSSFQLPLTVRSSSISR